MIWAAYSMNAPGRKKIYFTIRISGLSKIKLIEELPGK
jgi:hypothetical protein